MVDGYLLAVVVLAVVYLAALWKATSYYKEG